MFEVQDVRLDPESRTVWRGGTEIALSRKEFDLVLALISRAGEIVSRDQLMREVWHTTFWTSSKTIDVHLGWVRRKLGDDSRRPTLITTIRAYSGILKDYGDPRQGAALREGRARRRVGGLLGFTPCPSRSPPPSPSSAVASSPG